MLGKKIVRSLLNNARITAWTLLTLTTCATLVTLFSAVAFEVGKKTTGALRRVGANAVAVGVTDWARFEDEARGQGADVVRISGRVGLIDGRAVAVMAATPSALRRLAPFWAITGKWADREDECLVGRRVAEAFHLQPGSRIAVEWPGRNQAARYAVSGIAETGDEDDHRIFTVGSLPGADFSYALLSVPGGEEPMRDLRRAGGGEIKPLRQILYGERHVLEKINVLFVSTLGAVLLLTALGVSASMLARVVERRKEFALLRALGARRRDVVKFLLAESAAVGVVAAGMGFLLGSVLAAAVVRQVFQVSIAPHGSALAAALAATTGVALLAGAIACGRALRFQPAAALRGE